MKWLNKSHQRGTLEHAVPSTLSLVTDSCSSFRAWLFREGLLDLHTKSVLDSTVDSSLMGLCILSMISLIFFFFKPVLLWLWSSNRAGFVSVCLLPCSCQGLPQNPICNNHSVPYLLSDTFSGPAFLMMYSAYKLNKQGDNIQPWRIPFPIWNRSLFHVQF